MSCWDLLGIAPTRNPDEIRAAYERQRKFASDDEARALDQAYREALGEDPSASMSSAAASEDSGRPVDLEPMPVSGPSGRAADDQPLDAADDQMAREVVIQIRALLNDARRSQDLGVWKAIVCEPPADRPDVRRAIAERVEGELRPLAENGALEAPVARFLGDWFGWFSVREAVAGPEEENAAEPARSDGFGEAQPPQLANFWPAVIGWIVALAILAAIFGGMGGGQ